MLPNGGWLAIGAIVLTVAGACGGRVEGTPDGGGGDAGSGGSGSSSSSSSSSSGGGTTDGQAGTSCVDVSLSSFDSSCHEDGDCTIVMTGQICTGDCLCGGSTINLSSLPSYEAAIAGIKTSACGCPAEPVPQCLGGTCALCLGSPNDPPACPEAFDT
jgi:hypothetical protein